MNKITSDSSNSKILVVDDDDTFFNLLSNGPLGKKCFISWAQNGEEGYKKAKKQLPRVLITDIMMPRCNGFELIKNLKREKETAEINFVILSDYGEVKNIAQKQFLDYLGIKRYLVKSSCNINKIVSEIEQLL